jgi:hypothetical protein
MNGMELKKALEEMEHIVGMLESELSIRRFCAEKGLDPGNASEYAKAACFILEYEAPEHCGKVAH